MKKVYSNFIYQSLFQVLTVILPMITIPIVSRALGAVGIGYWGFTNSIVSYFLLLAGLGMANYAIREIAYVKDDRDKLSEKFWELQCFNMFFSTGVFLVYITFFLMIGGHYLYIIQSLMILGVFFDVSWLFQGIEEFKKIALRKAVIKLSAAICIVFLIRTSSDLWVYALILSASQLISAISLWPLLIKHITFKKVTLRAIWSHFLPALNFFILKISATIFMNINRTILGITSTIVMVGYFTASLQLIVVLGTITGAVNQVMLPRMSNLQREDKEARFVETLQKTIHIQLFFSIALMFGIIVINEKFVSWFLGEEFYFAKNLIPILAPILVFQQLHQAIANQFLVPKNEMKLYNLTMILGTLINVAISLALIPFIDAYGAALGFLLGQLFLMATRAAVMLKKSTFRFDWIKILQWIFSGLIMLGITWRATRTMPPTAFTTLIQGVVGVFVYMILTFMLKVNPVYSLLTGRVNREM